MYVCDFIEREREEAIDKNWLVELDRYRGVTLSSCWGFGVSRWAIGPLHIWLVANTAGFDWELEVHE